MFKFHDQTHFIRIEQKGNIFAYKLGLDAEIGAGNVLRQISRSPISPDGPGTSCYLAHPLRRGVPAKTVRGEFDTFLSILTGEKGAISKVEQSTPNLTSCGPCMSGVTALRERGQDVPCPKIGRADCANHLLTAFAHSLERITSGGARHPSSLN